jgi:hypothetical protein
LTGKPSNPEGFVALLDNEIQILLARDIWETLTPETERVLIAMQEYGRFWLWFKDSPGEDKGQVK